MKGDVVLRLTEAVSCKFIFPHSKKHDLSIGAPLGVCVRPT